jgi:shikimate dehydrogenase
MTKRLYFIIGDPIGQARSPEVFNARFAARGLDCEMLPIEVSRSDFVDAMDGLAKIRNCGGVIVTVPHKTAAAELASVRSKRVEVTGAANVMRWTTQGWDADLFDGEGFVRGLTLRNWTLAGRRVGVVGAGGAGLAISAAMLEAGVSEISIDDLDLARAERAVSRLQASYPERIVQGRPSALHSLAVNATPAGMRESDPMPINLDDLAVDCLVADVIMKPPKTRLLLEAERRGMQIQPGAPMLDMQADLIWRFFGL